jgi:hypothetical protein
MNQHDDDPVFNWCKEFGSFYTRTGWGEMYRLESPRNDQNKALQALILATVRHCSTTKNSLKMRF